LSIVRTRSSKSYLPDKEITIYDWYSILLQTLRQENRMVDQFKAYTFIEYIKLDSLLYFLLDVQKRQTEIPRT